MIMIFVLTYFYLLFFFAEILNHSNTFHSSYRLFCSILSGEIFRPLGLALKLIDSYRKQEAFSLVEVFSIVSANINVFYVHI